MFFTFMLERSAAQPVAAQVLYARGEREGRCVDGGRGGVPSAQTPEGLLSGVRPLGVQCNGVTHLYNCSLYISAPTRISIFSPSRTPPATYFWLMGTFPIIISISILSALILTSLSSCVRPVLLHIYWHRLCDGHSNRVVPLQKLPFNH